MHTERSIVCCVCATWIIPRRHIGTTRWSYILVMKVHWIWLIDDHSTFSMCCAVELSHVLFVLEVDAPGSLASRIQFHSAVAFSSHCVRFVRVVQDHLLVASVPFPHTVLLERSFLLVTQHVPLERWKISVLRHGRLRLCGMPNWRSWGRWRRMPECLPHRRSSLRRALSRS